VARARPLPRPGRGAGRLEDLELTLSPRNRELAFLIVVGILTAIGFASVYIARQSVVSTASLTYAALFFALYLVAHLVARQTVPFADPYLLPITGLLTAIGLTEIYRLRPQDAFKQGFWIVVAVGLFSATLFMLRRDYRRLESYKYLFGLTAIVLLLLPLAPGLGRVVNGARLWVGVGSLQFQPGELAKIMLIVFLAGYLREKREVLAQGRLKAFGPLLVIWGMAVLVLLETRDLGGGLLYFGIFLGMLYVATARISYVAAGLGLFLIGSVGVWKVTPHVQERVTNWRHPWTSHLVYCPLTPGHPALRQNCQSYQLVKSLYSIANGGYGGTGLGKGTVDTLPSAGGTVHTIIPYANTDFIYSVLAQELGLIGASAFLLVYMIFVLRGMRTALLAQDGLSKLLAVGLTFGFALQTFIIVGGILRIIPMTGITLPFVSYGGSSVVANFLLLAGLLLVSNRANRELLR
jgi:cell division protein FtsW (lipid II flippase)